MKIREETEKKAQCKKEREKSGKWLNVGKMREETEKKAQCREEQERIREMA